jgi:hypothetical protein
VEADVLAARERWGAATGFWVAGPDDGAGPGADDRQRHQSTTKRSKNMALFMDVHDIDGGVSLADVAEAHRKDLEVQGKHGVNYLRFWVNEEAGKIFCLVEARSADDARAVHHEAHGLVPDEIWEVAQG